MFSLLNYLLTDHITVDQVYLFVM